MHIKREIFDFLDRHFNGQFAARPVTPAAWYYVLSGPQKVINAARLTEFTKDSAVIDRILTGDHRRNCFAALPSRFSGSQRTNCKYFVSAELKREKEIFSRAKAVAKLKFKDVVKESRVPHIYELCHVDIPGHMCEITTKTGHYKFFVPDEN
jgi:hypothetical protein